MVSAGKFHPLESSESDFLPATYIIETEDAGCRAQILDSLKLYNVDIHVLNEFEIFKGFSVKINSGHDGETLSKMNGVKNVWPVRMHRAPEITKSKVTAVDPEVPIHKMTDVDIVHQKYKLKGKGIKVGIVDSGLDYTHPAFAVPGATKGCFGKNCRVKYGHGFVGDDSMEVTLAMRIMTRWIVEAMEPQSGVSSEPMP